MVEALDGIGSGAMDGGAASALLKILQKQGLKFRLGTKVVGASRSPSGAHILATESAKGKDKVGRIMYIILFASA